MIRLKKVVCFIILMLLMIGRANALSVDKKDLTIAKGDNASIDLYANLKDKTSSVEFSLFYTTYDIPADFKPNGEYKYTSPSGSTHKITFEEAKEGKVKLGTISIRVVDSPKDTVGSINLGDAKATLTSGEKANLNYQTITVKVGDSTSSKDNQNTPSKDEEPSQEEKDKNLLKTIDSEITKINLKKDVFEYTVSIDENVEELDLKPTAIDDSYDVKVSTQKISELEDNKIIITVSKGEEKVDYIINVRIANAIAIDKGEFKASNDYRGKWIFAIIALAVLLAGAISLLFIRKKR